MNLEDSYRLAHRYWFLEACIPLMPLTSGSGYLDGSFHFTTTMVGSPLLLGYLTIQVLIDPLMGSINY